MNLKNALSIGLTIIVLLIVIRILNIAYPISVVSTSRSSEFSVVGEGKVDVRPDTSLVDVGISVSNALSVDEVQRQINDVNNEIINSLKKLGVQKKDITTSNYSIYPYYDSNSKITGYNGNVTVSIKVRSIQMTPKVIEAATNAGANQVQGTQFVVENPEKYREQARSKAIENARQQAAMLSKSLGIKLGKVTNAIESSPIQPVLYDTRGLGGGGGAQFEPGNQTITSVVTLYFEKK